MRIYTVSAALLAAAALYAAPAAAAPVSIAFSGYVTGATGDFNGLFGVAGSPAGTALSGAIVYDPASFNAPSATCTVNCRAWDSTDGSMPNGTVHVSQTINGVTKSWNGVYFSDLLLAYSTTGGTWQYNNLHQAFELVSETSTPLGNGTNVVQFNLGTLDNSVSIVNPALDPNGPFTLSNAQFQTNNASWNTATSTVQWDFTLTTIDAPEPGAWGVMCIGLVGLAAGRYRRMAVA